MIHQTCLLLLFLRSWKTLELIILQNQILLDLAANFPNLNISNINRLGCWLLCKIKSYQTRLLITVRNQILSELSADLFDFVNIKFFRPHCWFVWILVFEFISDLAANLAALKFLILSDRVYLNITKSNFIRLSCWFIWVYKSQILSD